MEGIRIWIASISAVTLIMAVVSSLVPKNASGRVCIMIGEILLCAVIISPIKGDVLGGFSDIDSVYRAEIEQSIEVSSEICNEMQTKFISERISAYVLEKAMSSGELYIEIEEGAPCSASGKIESEAAVKRVKKVLSDELSIPEERQDIRTEGE